MTAFLSDSKRSEILHWDGFSWTRVQSYTGELTAVAATGPDAAWAVGHEQLQGFILQWNGTSWQKLGSPRGHVPTALWPQAGNDVWLVSAAAGPGPVTDRIQHWDGTSWKGSPFSTWWLSALWGSGPGDIWLLDGSNIFHYYQP
ncbi:MAG: hypothetical protein U1A78_30570 [Polyangia bacterium]